MKTRCNLGLRDRNQRQLALAFQPRHLECLSRDLGREVNLDNVLDRNIVVEHFIRSQGGHYFQTHVAQAV